MVLGFFSAALHYNFFVLFSLNLQITATKKIFIAISLMNNVLRFACRKNEMLFLQISPGCSDTLQRVLTSEAYKRKTGTNFVLYTEAALQVKLIL